MPFLRNLVAADAGLPRHLLPADAGHPHSPIPAGAGPPHPPIPADAGRFPASRRLRPLPVYGKIMPFWAVAKR